MASQLVGSSVDPTNKYSFGNDTLWTCKYTATANGYSTQFKIKIQNACNIKVGIYSHKVASDCPETLLGSVGSTAVSADWNTISFPTVYIQSGTIYWLAFNFDTLGGAVFTDTNNTSIYYKTYTFTDDFETTWTGSGSHGDTATQGVQVWGNLGSPSQSISPSESGSASLSPSASVSPSASESKSVSPSASESKSLSPSSSESKSLSPSTSESKSLSPSASKSSSISPSASESESISPSASESRSISPSKSSSASESPSASISPSASASESVSPSASESKSLSPSTSESKSLSPSASESKSVSPSASESKSVSPSASESKSISPSASPSQGYAMYTRGEYENLPADDTNLTTNYSVPEVDKVSLVDGQTVGQTATENYMIHQFKNFVGDNPSCQVTWTGQSSLAPSASIVKLQIYNIDTTTWVDVATNNAIGADTDFTLSGPIADLSPYTDTSNVITCRVWQEAT